MTDSSSNTKVDSYQGVLQRYKVPQGPSFPMFLNGNLKSDKALILMGGLYDGLVSLPYHDALSGLCLEIGWTTVQPYWTGAYHGFAIGSLEKDTEELEAAIQHLRAQGKSAWKKTIVVLGSSTGCQDIMTYLLKRHPSTPIEGGILQAPVSDRECFDEPKVIKAGQLAEEMVKQGRGHELVPREVAKEAFGMEMVTAYRMWSLLCVGGDDDFFSSDLPEEAEEQKTDGPSHRPLSETFGKLPTDTPLLFLFSGKDHSFPFSKTTPQAQFERWERAAKKGKKEGEGEVKMQFGLVEGASHQVDEIDLQPRLVEIIKTFLLSV